MLAQKCVSGDSGIDASMFAAHSVRGAPSSAAAMAGITTNDILKAADWSTDLVFRRFYILQICTFSKFW